MALGFIAELLLWFFPDLVWVLAGERGWQERLAIFSVMVLVFAGIGWTLYLVFPLLPTWLFWVVAVLVVFGGFAARLFVVDLLMKVSARNARMRHD